MSFFWCPCGCKSTGWETDPACVTQQPIGPAIDWAEHNGHELLEAA